MPNGYTPGEPLIRVPKPESLDGWTKPEVLPTIIGLQGLTPTKES